ncbi:MAG: SLC13 family permease [Candidatus Thermoplasmatota archaeon]|nr:SLC13 family permease [Candidatus Thermoplasmatota archaeon]
MSPDSEFEDMLESLEIVAESMEEEHIVPARVDQLKRRRTLLGLQSNLLDSKVRQHALYRLYLNSTFRKFGAGFMIVSFIHLLLFIFADGLSPEGRNVFTLFLFIIYLWVSETFPLPVTALMAGVGLVLLGEERDAAFSSYASDSVFMILGSLIIAQGISKSGAENLIIRKLLAPFTRSNYSLIFGTIVICSFMAAIIPDHSVAAIMLPIVLTIADKTDIRKRPNEMIALVLAVAFSCSIAGLATPSGGARNVIAMGFLEELYDIRITYVQWVILAAPLTIALVPFVFLTLVMVNKVRYRSIDYYSESTHSIDDRQLIALSVLALTFILFLTSGFNGLTLGTCAMIGGILMHVTGVLEWEDSRQRLRWGVMFIYGAALTMGKAMVNHGAADWLAGGLYRLADYGSEIGGDLTIVFLIIIVTVLLTNVMSDGAAAAILVPITLAVGFQAGFNLAFVAIITAVSTAFAFMTSFGTPPNLIVQASGIPRSSDFVRNGLPLIVISILLLMVAQTYYWGMASEWARL